MISYEVASGLIIVCVCIPANCFNLSYIIVGQEGYRMVCNTAFSNVFVSALAEIEPQR